MSSFYLSNEIEVGRSTIYVTTTMTLTITQKDLEKTILYQSLQKQHLSNDK